jgi:uncharacterized protein (DUF2252 family)
LLSAITLGENGYLLKELQPTKEPTDRVELKKLGKTAQLEKLMTLMGKVVAWGELRGSGYRRAANADELIDFARSKGWQKSLMKSAQDYSERVSKAWSKYSAAYDDGEFHVFPKDQ